MLRPILFFCLITLTASVSCGDSESISIPVQKKAYLHSMKTLPVPILFDGLRFDYTLETTSTQISVFAEPLYDETILINGIKAASRVLTLSNGTNLILVQVSKPGVQDSIYTLRAVCHDPRYDTRLESLSVADTVLKPAWSLTNMLYSCGKQHTNTIFVTASTRSSLALLRLNGLSATNGVPRPVAIIQDPGGTNQTIRLEVISSDLALTNQILLTVQYLPPEKDPRLRELTTDVSVLVPAFERDTPTYTLYVSTNCVSLTPTLLLAGQTMTVAGTPAASGTPVVFANLKEGSVTNIAIRVTSVDASVSQTYTVSVRYDWVWSYTPVNYDFDGGIRQYLEKIPYSAVNGATYSTVTVLTGIVTAANIAHSATYTKCFFIQDKNAGIYVYTASAPSEIRTGNKVVISATSAKYYFGMPEVTSFSWQSTLSRYHAIYYPTGYYAQPEFIGQVFVYSGPVWSSMDRYFVGKFDEDLYFHSVKETDWEWMLGDGQGGDFFGPVTYSYNLYRMEIPSMEHIR